MDQEYTISKFDRQVAGLQGGNNLPTQAHYDRARISDRRSGDLYCADDPR